MIQTLAEQQALLILTNVPDDATARTIAQLLVERQLAACVNILPGVHSVYRWQGAVEEAAEVTMLIKGTAARYGEIEAAIAAAHPYDVPEIIALPINTGLPKYLDWIASETKRDVDV
jgi:periplasmic divalent cation tolerance protein